MHDRAPPRDRPGGPASPPDPPDLQQAGRDWMTIWQSEFAALATDRELHETWQTLAAQWAYVAGAMVHAVSLGARDAQSGPGAGPGSTAPAGAQAAAAAPGFGDSGIEHFADRIAELERRLADVEGSRRNDGGDG